MCLFVCDGNCKAQGPRTFVLAPDQNPHPNQWWRFQPDPSRRDLFHLGKNFPDGECIAILPCEYCLSLDSTMNSYWWRVPREPLAKGAAKRPTLLWKRQPLIDWEIVDRNEYGGYVIKKEVAVEGSGAFDPFAGVPNRKKPVVAVPKRRKSKRVSWPDEELDGGNDNNE